MFWTPILRIEPEDGWLTFSNANLHLMNYSSPIHATMPLRELKPHLFTLPGNPDWIPVPNVLLPAKIGDSAFLITRCWRCRTVITRYASTRLLEMGI